MNTAPWNKRVQRPKPISFALLAAAAGKVSLAGDFNNWDPHAMPMHKGADGRWQLTVGLKPGRHEYRFVVDDVWQDDPAAIQRTTNAFGSENCVRTIAD